MVIENLKVETFDGVFSIWEFASNLVSQDYILNTNFGLTTVLVHHTIIFCLYSPYLFKV